MRIAFLVHGIMLTALTACGSNGSNYSGTSGKAQIPTAQNEQVETNTENLSQSETGDESSANAGQVSNPIGAGTGPAPKALATLESSTSASRSIIDASQLPANRKSALNDSVNNLLVAVDSKNAQSIATARSNLTSTAIGQSFGGFGLAAVDAAGAADVAAILDAVKDLVAAAMDADLDGIRKAVEDIVAASM